MVTETKYKMGASTYDFSSSEVVFGEDFEISEPTPLADAAKAKGRAIFLGTVFDIQFKETRAGDKTTVTIGVSDGASAIYVKKTLLNEEIGWTKGVKPGAHFALFGRVMFDKFDGEPFLSPIGIKKIKACLRTA